MEDYTVPNGIKSWAEADRPREKLMMHGRRVVSDAELLGILIATGNKSTNQTAVQLGQQVLKQYGDDIAKLATAEVKDLCRVKGIGPAKAITIVAALELGRRHRALPVSAKAKITSSTDIFALLEHKYADLNHEEFWIVLLNRANVVIGTYQMSVGGQTGTVADSKVIFKKVLAEGACSIILTHNHPSGNRQPSNEDKNITRQHVEAGKLLDVQVLDHVIFAGRQYFSFRDEGLM